MGIQDKNMKIAKFRKIHKISKKEASGCYLHGLVFGLFIILVVWGGYLVNTPLEYCEYYLCIKIGDKSNG